MNASCSNERLADIDQIVKTNKQEQKCSSIQEKTNIFSEEIPVHSRS